jgi:NADP-dependent 3-hydroxy acid dehydrogenase YdfG
MPTGALRGQVAVITGASSGIGEALARELAAQGCRVALVARRIEALEALAAELREQGGEALAIMGDVTDSDQMERMARTVLDTWGRVDIVIANAGIYVQTPVTHMTLAQLEASMDCNFYGAVRIVFPLLPAMIAQRSGQLVLMSSQDALIPVPGDGPYVVSKMALDGLGQVMRQELRSLGISVMVVYPGRIDTPMIDHLKMPFISPKVAPEPLARLIVRAIIRRRRRVIYPASGYLHLLRVLSPAFGDWLIRVLRLQGWTVTPPQQKHLG